MSLNLIVLAEMLQQHGPRGDDPLSKFIGLSVFVLISLTFGWKAAGQYFRSRETMRWRPVPAEILESVNEQVVSPSGEKERGKFRARIRYSYTALGDPYEGTQVHVGYDDWAHGDWKRASKTVARYPLGAVTVYVNPFKPNEAVLERGELAAARKNLAIAMTVAVATVVFAAFGG